MPITSEGLIVPKGPVQKAGPPILVPKRAPKQAVRVGGKTVATSLVRAASMPTGGMPRAQRAPGRLPVARGAPLRMPNVARPRAFGHTVPVRWGEPSADAAERAREARDLFLIKQVSQVIQAHYPGHAWAVEVPPNQGVVLISIPLFMGRTKWTLYVDHLASDPGMRSVVRACGEILERYRIPRAGFLPDRFVEAVNKIPPWKRARGGQIPS